MCIIFFKKVLRESGLRLIYSEADVDFLVPSPGGRVRAKQSSWCRDAKGIRKTLSVDEKVINDHYSYIHDF